jgi:hypothetical protein
VVKWKAIVLERRQDGGKMVGNSAGEETEWW